MSTPTKKNHLPLILTLLVLMCLSTFVAMYYGFFDHPKDQPAKKDLHIDGMYLPNPTIINDFRLKSTEGGNFTKASLQGHWTMMFFGFTNCGLVCPTTMAAVNKMYKTLQTTLPDAKLPQVVMITVDPETDDLARLKSYVKTFNPHFTGARGNEEETIALEKQLHIVAQKLVTEGKGKHHYTINHTAEILLFNPQGGLQAYLSYPHTPEQMVKDYLAIISAVN